jgi:phosphoadenosine phosphosulfate reductase
MTSTVDLRDHDLDERELRARVAQANHDLAEADALDVLRWGREQFGDGLVLTSSMADTVLISLAEQVAPGIDVIFLDTGYHFAETIGTRDAVASVHDINLITITPELTVAEQDAAHGKDLFGRNPDLCCAMRKVAPLDNALKGYSAWASGIRRADSPARANTPIVSWDHKRKMVRLAPIARWSDEQVASYIEANGLLVNPLLDDGYASIGCAPCTQRAAADDPRAGRWAGLAKTECGIH